MSNGKIMSITDIFFLMAVVYYDSLLSRAQFCVVLINNFTYCSLSKQLILWWTTSQNCLYHQLDEQKFTRKNSHHFCTCCCACFCMCPVIGEKSFFNNDGMFDSGPFRSILSRWSLPERSFLSLTDVSDLEAVILTNVYQLSVIKSYKFTNSTTARWYHTTFFI